MSDISYPYNKRIKKDLKRYLSLVVASAFRYLQKLIQFGTKIKDGW